MARPLRRVRVRWRLLRGWWSRAEFALARRFGLATREDRRFFLLVPAAGLLAGGLGTAINLLIAAVRELLWGSGDNLLEAAAAVPTWLRIGAPALGGLLVGLVIWLGRQPVAGTGMSILIESVALRGGVVPARPVVLSAIAAVFTVGSGGSLGKEGPMIRLGAMISSQLGERLGLGPHRLKTLVGCGAAAGLAAAYNIPVGGALFAMEVILGNFALEIFGPIVVASVISTLVSRAVLGDVPVYAVPDFELGSAWQLLPFLGLGVIGAFTSIVFVLGVRGVKDAFARAVPLPAPLQPVLGFGLLGALSLAAPHVLGSGFESISLAVHQGLELHWLLVLPAAKIVATALTAGSGGSGGMFTPSLFVGAMVGGSYGYLLHAAWPELVPTWGAFAAVGMAAMAAGSSHAPISAILILFEFTGNYDLILPLMIASIVASFLSRGLYPYSVYEESLRRKGLDLRWRMEEAVLAGLEARSLMRDDIELLRPEEPYARVVERFLGSRRQRLFVVARDGRLAGAVSLHDIKHVLEAPSTLTAVVAHDLMTPVDTTLRPETRLHHVAEAFSRSDFERLPVVDEEGRFQGLVAKRDLLAIYSQEVLGRPAMLATFVSGETGREFVELPPDFSLRQIPLPPDLAGRTLAEARLPQTHEIRVLEIQKFRDGVWERSVPEAATVLHRQDHLVVIGPTAALERLQRGGAASDEAMAHRQID